MPKKVIMLVAYFSEPLLITSGVYIVKKAFRYSRPQPGCHLPTLPGREWDDIYKLFPPRESLVSDIPAGDGNIKKLFLQCNLPMIKVVWLTCRSRFLRRTEEGQQRFQSFQQRQLQLQYDEYVFSCF
jgi:hypothetical protein